MTSLPAMTEGTEHTANEIVGAGGFDPLTLASAHEPDYPWEPAWKAEFLKAFRILPSPTAAARMAGVTRQAAYYQRNHDELFRIVWDDARDQGLDTTYRFLYTLSTPAGIETNETRRTVKRALNAAGELVVVEDTTVEIQGRLVDPASARWLLANQRREEFGAQLRHEHSGPSGGPVQVEVYRHPDAERALELARIAVELGPDDVEHGDAVEITDEEVPDGD